MSRSLLRLKIMTYVFINLEPYAASLYKEYDLLSPGHIKISICKGSFSLEGSTAWNFFSRTQPDKRPDQLVMLPKHLASSINVFSQCQFSVRVPHFVKWWSSESYDVKVVVLCILVAKFGNFTYIKKYFGPWLFKIQQILAWPNLILVWTGLKISGIQVFRTPQKYAIFWKFHQNFLTFLTLSWLWQFCFARKKIWIIYLQNNFLPRRLMCQHH